LRPVERLSLGNGAASTPLLTFSRMYAVKQFLPCIAILTGALIGSRVMGQLHQPKVPPHRFPGGSVMTRKQIDKKNSPLQPLERLSASKRYQEAKTLYELSRRAKIARVIEIFEEAKKPTAATKKALEALHSGTVPEAVSSMPVPLKLALTSLAPDRIGIQRVRMAYSDLARELRDDQKDDEFAKLQEDLNQFRQEFEPGKNYEFETWRELDLYDLAIARTAVVDGFFSEPFLLLMTSEDAQGWLITRIGEGLSLPRESCIAEYWHHLRNFHSVRARVDIQLQPLLKSSNEKTGELILSVVWGFISESRAQAIRQDERQNIFVDSDERLEIEQDLAARENRDLNRLREIEVADVKVADLERQVREAKERLFGIYPAYAEKRAVQLGIPNSTDSVQLQVKSDSVVLTNVGDRPIIDAVVFVTCTTPFKLMETTLEIEALDPQASVTFLKGFVALGRPDSALVVGRDFWCRAKIAAPPPKK
jgi:hypothetical protein